MFMPGIKRLNAIRTLEFAQKFGIGIVMYNRNWYGIADKEVLVIGLIAVMLCAIMRTVYEGKGWIKRMMPHYF